MITKGGLETITQHLAMEYAKDGIRVNAVAPGVVYTPLHRDTPKDVMESLSPMGRPSTVKEIADAVMYLTDAATVTGARSCTSMAGHTSAAGNRKEHSIMTTTRNDRRGSLIASSAFDLPDAPTPFGAYVPAVQTGQPLFLSGMLATSGHAATTRGRRGQRLGREGGARGGADRGDSMRWRLTKKHLAR